MKCEKGDVYQLRDKETGYIDAIFEITRAGSASLDGILKEVTCWDSDDKTPIEYDFIADIYFKWDSCTHWWFRGEDYIYTGDDTTKGDIDGYYHLCGPQCFMSHIRNMCFAWKVAGELLADPRETGDHLNEYDPKYIKELTELMLKDYEIFVSPSKSDE